MKIDISQRIGICYKNEEWAKEVLDQIYSQTPENMIAKRMKNGIDFIDGSYVRAFPANESCRGRKLNKIYVQESVDEEYINTHLRPCIMFNDILRERVIDSTGEVYFWWRRSLL